MKRPRWTRERQCQVPGCDQRAPGTHPLCRQHAAQLPRDEYQRLRFHGDDKQLAAIVQTLNPANRPR